MTAGKFGECGYKVYLRKCDTNSARQTTEALANKTFFLSKSMCFGKMKEPRTPHSACTESKKQYKKIDNKRKVHDYERASNKHEVATNRQR